MKLIYTAFDKSGKAVTDTVEARDIAEATEVLRRQGFYITEIKETDDHANLNGALKLGGKLGKGRRLKNVAIFMRQMFVLLSTGTTMVDALSALERQTNDPNWRNVIEQVREKVEEGAP